MKEITRKLLAIAMAVALTLGGALAETAAPAEAAAPEIDARALYEEGIEAYGAEDYATALEKFTPAAEAGYAEAQYQLGVMYEDGIGVEVDVEKAIDLLTKAADQGHILAMMSIGVLYQLGELVEEDDVKALEWLKKAALQATIEEDINPELAKLMRSTVIEMYRNGVGTEPDMAAAEEWYDEVMKASPNYVDPDDPLVALTNVEAIEMAQSRLNQVGYDCGREDGVLDEATEAQITKFQQDKGLTVTNTLTRETAYMLYDVTYRVTTSDEVQTAQSALNALGYDCGAPDGIAGKKTAAALTQFQQDEGLTVTGTLTYETLNALKACIAADDPES